MSEQAGFLSRQELEKRFQRETSFALPETCFCQAETAPLSPKKRERGASQLAPPTEESIEKLPFWRLPTTHVSPHDPYGQFGL